jgi:hypothetical protein
VILLLRATGLFAHGCFKGSIQRALRAAS